MRKHIRFFPLLVFVLLLLPFGCKKERKVKKVETPTSEETYFKKAAKINYQFQNVWIMVTAHGKKISNTMSNAFESLNFIILEAESKQGVAICEGAISSLSDNCTKWKKLNPPKRWEKNHQLIIERDLGFQRYLRIEKEKYQVLQAYVDTLDTMKRRRYSRKKLTETVSRLNRKVHDLVQRAEPILKETAYNPSFYTTEYQEYLNKLQQYSEK